MQPAMADAALPVTIADIAARLTARLRSGDVAVIGVTGSVAAGKSTLCAALAQALAPQRVDTVSTDGFLLPNATLDARGLTLLKGYPQSYDIDALFAALTQARAGATIFPTYSHLTYDVDPALARSIDRPDLLLIEGLGLSPLPDGRNAKDHLDALVYIDASEEHLETWFLRRFMGFWRAAEHDPASFYARFRGMSEPDAETFARGVWARINLPNLREHISRARDGADIVVRKNPDHTLTLARG